MSIIVCENIGLSYGVDVILDNISFAVNPGARVGIIGANGAGKTTLLKMITGSITPSHGDIFISKNTTIGFLEQISDDKVFGNTVRGVALSAFNELQAIEAELTELESQLGSGNSTVLNRYSTLQDKYKANGGLEYKERTKSMLTRFGFDDALQQTEADKLSGGQKTKLLLVLLLLKDPDIILLDEPTNHLDISSVDWLENYIKSSKKTFLIVSHDRYFLDHITTDTLEIEHKVSRIYSGSYSVYREKKRKLDEDRLKHYLLQQQEIKKIQDYIEQQKRWNQERNYVNIKNREKMIGRMELINKPKAPPKTIHFDIADTTSKSFDVLSVRALSKSYPDLNLFNDLSFDVHYGDRLFVIGDNGCGKSTLLKILTGRLKQDSGVYELGYSQSIGYYDQDQKLLNNSNTVMDELWEAYSDNMSGEIRKILAQFGFYGEDVFKSISVLSGGERARVSIAKMILKGVSLLILDEPTNHLDIPSKEILENAITEYNGTVICVSHDRYFISALSTRILDISAQCYSKGYEVYDCGYKAYLDNCRRTSPVADVKTVNDSKQDHDKTKKDKNKRKYAVVRYHQLETEITKSEEKLSELQLSINDALSDYKKLNEIYAQIENTKALIDSMYEEMFTVEQEIN